MNNSKQDRIFYGCIFKESDGETIGRFPDIPGLTCRGATLEEARANARNVLTELLDDLRKRGATPPQATSPAVLQVEEGERAIPIPAHSDDHAPKPMPTAEPAAINAPTRRAGRPPKPVEERATIRINMVFTRAENDVLKKLAMDLQTSKTKVVKRALATLDERLHAADRQ